MSKKCPKNKVKINGYKVEVNCTKQGIVLDHKRSKDILAWSFVLSCSRSIFGDDTFVINFLAKESYQDYLKRISQKEDCFTNFKIYKSPKLSLQTTAVECETSEDAQDWISFINDCLTNLNRGPQKALAFVNPFSGNKKAVKRWYKIQPILTIAGTEIHQLVITERENHCKELISSMQLEDIDVIITCGGDGILNELINGIMEREDWQRVIKIPIAVLPCGSGNALSTTLKIFSPYSAAMAIIQKQTKPLDLVAFYQPEDKNTWKLIRFGFEGLLWGLVSDIDFESESMRYLSDTRFTIGAIKRITALRHYPVEIGYIDDSEKDTDERKNSKTFRVKLPCGLKTTIRFDPLEDTSNAPSYWYIHNMDLVYFVACNISHISTDIKAAPQANLDDGKIDLVFSNKTINKKKILKFFVNGSMETGEYINSKSMEYIKTSVFLLNPIGKSSLINIDGERCLCKPTIGEVFSHIVSVVAPDWRQELSN